MIRGVGSDPDTPNIPTFMNHSSMHHCGGYCMFMGDIANVEIDNNVFFWGKKFLVYVE